MKKVIKLLLCLVILTAFEQIATAILTDQSPIKNQNSNSTTIKTEKKYKNDNIKQTSTQDISKNEIDAYKNKIIAILDKNKDKPIIWGKETTLSTDIEFGIADNGRINYHIVTKSSGDKSFDSSMSNSVVQLFDPLPISYEGTCPRMYETSYGRKKCLVMTHTFTRKTTFPPGYVKPKNEINKIDENHIKDIQKSYDELFSR